MEPAKKQRMTRQRQLVLDVVRAREDHPSADEVYLNARAIDGKISRGTVYRNLHTLVELGEILKVRLPDVDRYEARTDKHYHLICSECGSVFDAQLSYNEGLDEQAARQSGWDIRRHRTIFEGRCPACRSQQAEDAEP